jgi:hypothetical protein
VAGEGSEQSCTDNQNETNEEPPAGCFVRRQLIVAKGVIVRIWAITTSTVIVVVVVIVIFIVGAVSS